MRYYKIIMGGYIQSVGTGMAGQAITEAEYHNLRSVIQNRPAAADGYDYRLTGSLEWDPYELPQEITDSPELSAEEALEIIMGGDGL